MYYTVNFRSLHFLVFLYFSEAILSGGNEGSLSSESDESDNEHDCSKGRWRFLVFFYRESG